MALDLEKLLESFGDEEPSGEDLEYGQEFAELEIAAQSKGEQQVGDNVIEAEDADYAEVLKVGKSLLDGILRIDGAYGLDSPRGFRLDFYLDAIL